MGSGIESGSGSGSGHPKGNQASSSCIRFQKVIRGPCILYRLYIIQGPKQKPIIRGTGHHQAVSGSNTRETSHIGAELTEKWNLRHFCGNHHNLASKNMFSVKISCQWIISWTVVSFTWENLHRSCFYLDRKYWRILWKNIDQECRRQYLFAITSDLLSRRFSLQLGSFWTNSFQINCFLCLFSVSQSASVIFYPGIEYFNIARMVWLTNACFSMFSLIYTELSTNYHACDEGRWTFWISRTAGATNYSAWLWLNPDDSYAITGTKVKGTKQDKKHLMLFLATYCGDIM